MNKHFIYFLFFLPTLLFSQSWVQISDFPATERDDGTAFVIGNKAYCGSGQIPGWIPTGDFYSLDINTDTWDTIASMPAGAERQYASSFSYSNLGFVFGGFNGAYLNDIWCYNPLLNTWVSKTALPGAGRMGCASFVINGIAYLVGGRTSSAQSIKEVWAYDIVNDSWQQKNDMPFGARWRSASAEQNNKGYLLFGRDENNRYRNELCEYNPLSDSWTMLTSFPGNGRIYTSMVSISNDLVFFTGLDSFGTNYSDMWRINVNTLNFQQLSSIPALGRRGGIYFNSNYAIYYIAGVDQNNNRIKETWKVDNPTTITENKIIEKINSYPNPADQFIDFTIEQLNNAPVSIEIIDNTGRIIQKEESSDNLIRINSLNFINGFYFIRISTKNKIYYSKIAVLH
ncbi:MAG: T9SS type A sorting domain-containing protein [Bacteroidetes bacterium]|nr:T9SS type A sorting domain-containing protein [Bacteroidota bacterium]